jgi:5-methylcytosine-specific restriction endonuclease McrA
MAFDKIIALGGAISATALALNTINDIIGLVEERHQSGKSMLSNQQKSLQSPPNTNTILSRSSKQTMAGNYQNNLPRIDNNYPKKARICRICGDRGYTEWHHIISQSYARKHDQKDLIRNPGNVVELCKPCHDKTPASMSWKYLNSKEQKPKKKSRRSWW